MATTHVVAETVIWAYYSEADKFGLTMSISKIKFLVVGHEVQDLEMLPMTADVVALSV